MNKKNKPSLFSDAFVSGSNKSTMTPSTSHTSTHSTENREPSNSSQFDCAEHNSHTNSKLNNQSANRLKNQSNKQRNLKSEITSTASETSKNKEIKQVNIVISGFNYTINCPADERDELNKAAGYINGFIRELRKDAPLLSHENLLVLCCLNLFEEMQQQKNNTATLMETDKRVRSLLEKINSDAKSITV